MSGRSRRRRRLAWLSSIAVALAPGCSVSEPVIASGWTAERAAAPLSHADCVNLAEASATTAAAWRARWLTAEAALRQAHAMTNPTFTGSWENISFSPKTGVPLEQTFSFTMGLADFFAREYRVSAAEANLAAEDAALAAERRNLNVEVRHAYDHLVAARERVHLREDLVAAAERQSAVAERMVAVGLTARIDLERAATERMQAESDLAQAVSDAHIEELALAFALGFDAPVSLALSEPMSSLEGARIEATAEMVPEAIAAQPEVEVAKARYDEALANAQLAAHRFQLLPALTGGYRRAEGHDLGVASFELPVPIFDSGAAAEDAQNAALLAAASNLEQAVRRTGADMQETLARARAAHEQLTQHATRLAQKRHELSGATERLFAAGEAPYDDVLLARRDEITARLSLLEARANAASASVDLDKLFDQGLSLRARE
jgi:cobalt-zinc-cadmium efflux system outer membrane protein